MRISRRFHIRMFSCDRRVQKIVVKLWGHRGVGLLQQGRRGLNGNGAKASVGHDFNGASAWRDGSA